MGRAAEWRNARRGVDTGSQSEEAPQPAVTSWKPILIVEDDSDLRDALEYLLEACGYTIVAAADGEEA